MKLEPNTGGTVTGSPAHCAKFTDALLPVARHLLSCVAELPADSWVLDPFAGTGKGVDYMIDVAGFNAVGIELEPEFIESKNVFQGDALDLPDSPKAFFDFEEDEPTPRWDAIFTSPTYGNRMADRDMRDSVAGTYMKSLGRQASEGSSCHLQWGPKYREFHEAAWTEAARVVHDGGWFLLNIKDHFRDKKLQLVPEWHVETLNSLGFFTVDVKFVETSGLGVGANAELRATGEYLYLFQKGGTE